MAKRQSKRAGQPIRLAVRAMEEVPAEALPNAARAIDGVARAVAYSDHMPFRSATERRTSGGKVPGLNFTKVVSSKPESILISPHPAGVWSWMEDGVPRHETAARARRKGRDRRGRFQGGVATPNGPRIVAHASFPAKGSWSKVVAKSEAVVESEVLRTYDAKIRRRTKGG